MIALANCEHWINSFRFKRMRYKLQNNCFQNDILQLFQRFGSCTIAHRIGRYFFYWIKYVFHSTLPCVQLQTFQLLYTSWLLSKETSILFFLTYRKLQINVRSHASLLSSLILAVLSCYLLFLPGIIYIYICCHTTRSKTVFRFRQVQGIANLRNDYKLYYVNNLVKWFGYLACLGMFVVANVQVVFCWDLKCKYASFSRTRPLSMFIWRPLQ